MAGVVVIGASQGGVQALNVLVRGLTPGLAAPILVVMHIGSGPSILPSILTDIDGFEASFGRHGEAMQDGHIYVAPPDHHMLVHEGTLELSRSPRENWARPAIDPLFRSAAEAYGAGAIGIVLSGRLNDGTAGLYEIKRRGGIAIVQTPSEAEAPDMPRSALENVPVDYCLPLKEIPRLIARLVHEPQQRSLAHGPKPMEQEPQFDEPIAQTCPECGGAMREERVGNLTRFRCHIGHVMTAEVVAASQVDILQNDLSAALRMLNERVSLCGNIAEKYMAGGNIRAAQTWSRASEEAAEREKRVAELVNLEWHRPESDLDKPIEEPEGVRQEEQKEEQDESAA